MVNYKQIFWSVNSIRKFYTNSQNFRKPIQQNQIKVKEFHTTTVNRLSLTPQEINDILRENEFAAELTNSGPVKAYETNQLAANSPIEDYTAEAKCTQTTGCLFGVFDGHGGKSCAYVTSKRLFQYMAASLLPEEALNSYISDSNRPPLIEYFDANKAKLQFVPELNDIYTKSYNKFINDLGAYTDQYPYTLESMLEYTFNYFDNQLSLEFLDNYYKEKKVDLRLLNIAISGAVACVVYVDGHHLHIANTGDCCAVMGSVTEDNNWVTQKLCLQHTIENPSELKRVYDSHPDERQSVIKAERLLGQLLPLRAFGDFRYKWEKKIMEDLVVPVVGNIIPDSYYTPPYLAATPEMYTYKLTPRDRFVVLATDGLWDVFSPHEVVTLVGEHMLGKASFTPVQLVNRNVSLGEVMEILDERRSSLEIKPTDRNAATHLIRHAFGSTDSGIISNTKLSRLLTMPPTKARRFRDDISITIIYFDGEYLRNQPE